MKCVNEIYATTQTYGSVPSARESHTAVFYNPGNTKPQLIIYGGMCGTRYAVVVDV